MGTKQKQINSAFIEKLIKAIDLNIEYGVLNGEKDIKPLIPLQYIQEELDGVKDFIKQIKDEREELNDYLACRNTDYESIMSLDLLDDQDNNLFDSGVITGINKFLN